MILRPTGERGQAVRWDGGVTHQERGNRVGQASVRSLVQNLLRQPGFTRHTGWGGGVQRSELARSAHRMFDAEWVARGQSRLAAPDQGLSDRQEKVAREILQALEPRLMLIAVVTADLLAQVAQECERTGAPVTLDQISGRCTSAATTHVRRYGRAPTDPELAGTARRLATKVAANVTRCSADEFEDRYGQLFETEWRRQGGLNLAAFPPSLLLLGQDQRPPLIRRGARETDACGTDRSVYGRYASYRPPAPGQRVPFRSRAERCTEPVTLRSTSRDVAAEEVHRACLPYGLEQHSHRTVLRGTHHGLSFEWQDNRPALGRDLADRCVQLRCADELDVAETVRRLLQGRMARRNRPAGPTPSTLDVEGLHWAVDGYDPSLLAGHLDRVTKVITKRLWKAVHGLELYVEEHMCSCSLKAVVGVALDRAVPAARARWDDDEVCWDPTPPPGIPSPADNPSGPSDLIEAQNRTCELLIRQPQVARALLTLQPGWRTSYRELVAEDPHTYLSADEFARWCKDLVPGAHDHHDEEAQ